MKFKSIIVIGLVYLLAACSTDDEGVLDTQIDALDKAEELEKSIQDAAQEKLEKLEQQTQ